MDKDTTFSTITITCRKKIHTFSHPIVMGILNVTPDSFYDGGRYSDPNAVLRRATQILEEGAHIIDVGAVSSRPGAQLLSPEEEADRLVPAVALLRKHFPNALLSVDTCFSLPARKAVEAGADIINDISGGQFDPDMFSTIAQLQVPYILMHTRGTPDHMQDNPHYDDILQEVAYYFSLKLEQLRLLGVNDVILDPGFGFAKTVADNYQLFGQLRELQQLFPNLPMLVGISRKSMIYKPLGTTPNGALAGTIALNALALNQGAQILRVHDVREAVQTIQLFNQLWNS